MKSFGRNGLRFEVLDLGSPDADTVILLHGFPQHGDACWEQVAPLIASAGFRILAPNQRGYSPQARPRGRWSYRGSELVGDVLALIDASRKERVHLVGHDWGGAVAWATAAWHPHRLHTLTVLSTPHPAAFFGALLSSRQAMDSWYMYFFQLPWLPEWVCTAPLGRANPSLVRWLVASGQTEQRALRDAQRMCASRALGPAMNWYRAIPFSNLARYFLPVSVPTLYIWSDADVALNARAAALTERFVTGPYRFELMTGISHWIPDEAPGPAVRLIMEHLS
jgi:pimeloyl-ACP methyl ester carboxylesterase